MKYEIKIYMWRKKTPVALKIPLDIEVREKEE